MALVSEIHMQFSLFIFKFLLFMSNWCVIMMHSAEKDQQNKIKADDTRDKFLSNFAGHLFC